MRDPAINFGLHVNGRWFAAFTYFEDAKLVADLMRTLLGPSSSSVGSIRVCRDDDESVVCYDPAEAKT